MTSMIWGAFLAAAALGAVARHLVDRALVPNARFPWATFAVNVAGAAGLGFLVGAGEQAQVAPEIVIVVGGGFLGAFTTFSRFALDVVRLVETKEPGTALAYVSLTLVTGLAGGAAGLMLGSAIA